MVSVTVSVRVVSFPSSSTSVTSTSWLSVALWEQFHILNGDFIGNSFKLKAHRTEAVCQLGRTQKVFPERLFLPAKSSQRQPGGNAHRTLCFSTSLFDFLGNGCKGKQVVIVVFHFVAQDRLSARPAHEKLPAVLQCVLQGVGFVGIFCNTGWERKMPGFDGVIAMVDANVHGFAHPFWLVVENLKFLLVKSLESIVLSQLVKYLGGECEMGEKQKTAPACQPKRFLKKGALPPCILRA